MSGFGLGGQENSGDTQVDSTVANPSAEELLKQDTTLNQNANGLRSIASTFAGDISPVASQIIEIANEILKNKNLAGSASPVSIGGSQYFKGVHISLTQNGIKYSQAIVIDVRRVKTIHEILEDARMGRILFGTALLNEKNKSYLSEFARLSDNSVVLEPLLVVSEDLDTADKVKAYVVKVLTRIEAKPFNSSDLAKHVDADRSKELTSNFSTDNQYVKLDITKKSSIGMSVEDLINGGTNEELSVTARVEPLLVKGQHVEGQGLNAVTTQKFKLSPTVFIKSYAKHGTHASHSLEYGLLSIAAATIFLQEDKIYAALLPSNTNKLNIGALNGVMQCTPNGKDAYEPINLLANNVSIDMISVYFQSLLANAAIGIDLEYKTDVSAFSVFGTSVDKYVTAAEKEKANQAINTAYKNITGESYVGKLIDKTISYPTGSLTLSDGSRKDLSSIDAVWLASKGYYDEATNWLIADVSGDSLVEKLKLLDVIATKAKAEIKIKAIGYKIILSAQFVNSLLSKSRLSILSTPVLELPKANTFAAISNIREAEMISGNVGYQTSNGVNFQIIQ